MTSSVLLKQHIQTQMFSPIQFLSCGHPFSLRTLLILHTLLCVVDYLFSVVFFPFPVSILFVFFCFFFLFCFVFTLFRLSVLFFFICFTHCLVADVLIFSISVGCVCKSHTWPGLLSFSCIKLSSFWLIYISVFHINRTSLSTLSISLPHTHTPFLSIMYVVY